MKRGMLVHLDPTVPILKKNFGTNVLQLVIHFNSRSWSGWKTTITHNSL